MGDFECGSSIDIEVANTDITVLGNGAVFDAGQDGRFFYVSAVSAILAISNVTTQNGFGVNAAAGAIGFAGDTLTASQCTSMNNTATAFGYKSAGGAIYIGTCRYNALASWQVGRLCIHSQQCEWKLWRHLHWNM